ncbi:hypothetical protein M9434_003706 [Picochlorum sp. BPE23]|nr:hypothetical protein M9434_003706 [Picochlorum sp. BPE23]
MEWDIEYMSKWCGISGHGIGEWCRGSRECSSSGHFDLDSLGICTNTDSFGVVEYTRKKSHGHSMSVNDDESSPSSLPSSSSSVEGSDPVTPDTGQTVTPSSGIMFIFQQSYPDVSLEDQQEGGVGCVMDVGCPELSNVSDTPGTRQMGVMSAYEINVLSGLAEDQHDEYNVYPREGCIRVGRSRSLGDCLTAPAA